MIKIYGKQNCGFCVQAVQLLEAAGMEYEKYTIDENISRDDFIAKFPDVRTVPLIYEDDTRIGGYQQFRDYLNEKQSCI